MSAARDLESIDLLGWISHEALAKVLGKSNARAARDWCKRRGVPYRRDGKVNWVRVEDIRRVIEGSPANDSGVVTDDAVREMMRGTQARRVG